MLHLLRPESERSPHQGPIESLREFPVDFDVGHKD